MSVLTIFAGPNGSGKSSIIRRGDFAGRKRLLGADAIAKRMDSLDPQRAAIAAGREVLQRAREYIASGEDFSIETTLSGNWTTSVIKQAQARTFVVRLLFVCVESPERSIQRVHERVKQGGHFVPDEDVRRRYLRFLRSLSNLKQVLKIVDEADIYDNSGLEPELILELKSGVASVRTDNLPSWARNLAH